MIKDKYNRIIIEKLPSNIASEIEQIKSGTDNFTDEELIEIYQDNFNDLFSYIEMNHQDALKPKKKLVSKGKSKLVKKAEPKQKLVKKKSDSDPDLSNLVGRQFIIYTLGTSKGESFIIKDVSITDKKYDKRDVIISYEIDRKYEERFPLSKLDDFLAGKEIQVRDSKGEPYVLELQPDKKTDNCDEAITKLNQIEKKKEQAAEKRANAPKKKVSVAAREKQVKTAISVFKTKAFKGNKSHAEAFAKDLVAVYKKHGLSSIADQLQKDIDELIKKHYN